MPTPRPSNTPAGPPPLAAGPPPLAAALGTPSRSTPLRFPREELSTRLEQATGSPMSAIALAYSLVLDQSAATRESQFELLAIHDPPQLQATQALAPSAGCLDVDTRLTLAQLAVPARRQLSPGQYRTFRNCLQRLVQADRQVSLMKFSLEKLVLHQLDTVFQTSVSDRALAPPKQLLSIHGIMLLSALAHAGRNEEPTIRNAFASGFSLMRPWN